MLEVLAEVAFVVPARDILLLALPVLLAVLEVAFVAVPTADIVVEQSKAVEFAFLVGPLENVAVWEGLDTTYLLIILPGALEEALGLIVEEVPRPIVDGLLGPLVSADVPFVEELALLVCRQFHIFSFSLHD